MEGAGPGGGPVTSLAGAARQRRYRLAAWLPGRLFQLFQDQQTRESTLNVKKNSDSSEVIQDPFYLLYLSHKCGASK